MNPAELLSEVEPSPFAERILATFDGAGDASEARYQRIFEGARVALWDLDFSPLLDLLDRLRAQGVTDLREYFEARPLELANAAKLVRVRDVNNYAVELFEAGHKHRLLGAIGATFLPETWSTFLDEMVALWEGKRRFESEAVATTLAGRRLNVLLTIAWDGKRCEHSLVSLLDISKRTASEQGWVALYDFTDRLHRADSIHAVYDAALDAIIHALGSDRASILLFDEKDVMRFVASRGLSDGYRSAVGGHSPWTAGTRDATPIAVDDIDRADLPEDLRATIKGEGIGACAFIPLVAEGRLAGKFMTYYDAPHSFSKAETDLALTIARQLGFAIERLRGEATRRLTQASLRESERRLELALTAGRMGAWEWTINSSRVIWSPSLEAIHGMEPGAFTGSFEGFTRDIHPDDLETVVATIRKSLETRQNYHVAYRINRADGSVRWLEANGQVVLGPDGAPEKMVGVCMDVTERKAAEVQRDLLVAELSHRVKNTLAAVIAISRQSFANPEDGAAAHRSFDARIRALAQTHSRLADSNWSGVSLQAMLADELAPYRKEDGGNIRIAGAPIELTPKCALSLGMAVHELAMNAAKYGALSTETGRVDVGWQIGGQDRALNIRWTERGGPKVEAPTRTGFGRLLLERVLAADLEGDVKLDFAGEGVICVINVPRGARIG
jgi:PAS domain S-box-containing protein